MLKIAFAGIYLALLGIGISSPARANPVPTPKDRADRLEGIYKGTFTYSGPKGFLKGTALFSGSPSSDGKRIAGLLLLSPDARYNEPAWTGRMRIDWPHQADFADVVPFDKGKSSANGKFLPSNNELVTTLIPFREDDIVGTVRCDFVKKGDAMDIALVVRQRQGNSDLPTILVSFSGSRID